MDGRALLRHGEEALGGIAAEDRFFFFECLDKAAEDFIRETRILKDKTVIATVVDQQIYELPPDFINVYSMNSRQRYIAKYTTLAGTVSWPCLTSDEKIWRRNQTTAEVPRTFTVLEPGAPAASISGSATTAAAQLAGECQLIDSGQDFTTLGVKPRYRVQNLADGSHGIVLGVENATTLRVALFDGEANDFSLNDAYLISPFPCFRIQLEAPSPEAGATIELPYLALPAPVFSESGVWRIPRTSAVAITKEAAFKFNQEFDADPKLDQHLHRAFTDEIHRVKIEMAQRRLQGGRYNRRR